MRQVTRLVCQHCSMVKHSPYPDVIIPEVSLAELFFQRIPEFGNTVALVDFSRGVSLTFSDVLDNTKGLAAALHARGIRKGDVIALCTSNRVEYAIVILAAAWLGAIVTTCNPRYHAGEILQQFKISRPCMVFCDPDVCKTVQGIADSLPSLREIYNFGSAPGSKTYTSLINNAGKIDPPKTEINPKKDILLLPYSSGTTGLPKGVKLTHYNVVASVEMTRLHNHTCRSSCYYMVVPMFHTFGYSYVLYCLQQGTKLVFDVRFDLERLFRAAEQNKVTHFAAVPPMMIKLAQTPLYKKYDLSSLKRMVCGAAPIAPSLITTISKRYNILVSTSYGLTEIVPLSIADPIIKHKLSCGSICCNTIVKVVDVVDGRELGPGEDGEICAKSPTMMLGYFNNPKATSTSIDEDGWLHTGDIGHYDDDGLLYVVDRLKELIKFKGFQVAPAELEAALLRHPGVADAAVIGIPDSEAGEIPKGFVVKKDQSVTEDLLKKFIADELAHFKHLRGGVEFLDVIPKSPSGKILRRELRQRPVKRASL